MSPPAAHTRQTDKKGGEAAAQAGALQLRPRGASQHLTPEPRAPSSVKPASRAGARQNCSRRPAAAPARRAAAALGRRGASSQMVTGASTRCTLASSTRISTARSHSAFTSLSFSGSQRFNCSKGRQRRQRRRVGRWRRRVSRRRRPARPGRQAAGAIPPATHLLNPLVQLHPRRREPRRERGPQGRLGRSLLCGPSTPYQASGRSLRWKRAPRPSDPHHRIPPALELRDLAPQWRDTARAKRGQELSVIESRAHT